MSRHTALTRLLLALSETDEADLRELALLLREPAMARSLSMLVDSLAEVRGRAAVSGQVSSTPHAACHAKDIEPDSRTGGAMSDTVPTEFRLRQALRDVILDKELFASTADAVRAVNRAFGWGLRYEDYRRSGRRALFRMCWASLASLPPSVRVAELRAFFDTLPAKSSELDSYRKLFRILARNE